MLKLRKGGGRGKEERRGEEDGKAYLGEGNALFISHRNDFIKSKNEVKGMFGHVSLVQCVAVLRHELCE
jgi:hypothetical protein